MKFSTILRSFTPSLLNVSTSFSPSHCKKRCASSESGLHACTSEAQRMRRCLVRSTVDTSSLIFSVVVNVIVNVKQ
jgi:hypothetical protein